MPPSRLLKEKFVTVMELTEGATHGRALAGRLLAGLLTLTAALSSCHSPSVPGDRFLDSDGVRIRFVDRGPRDADPIVLIHGGFMDLDRQWVESGVMDDLDDAHRVVAPDLRGHGKSDKPHEAEAYGSAMVEDVIRLLDHLEISRAHVLSYSMGGRIAFKLVADHPDRVLSAIIGGTDGEPLTEEFLGVLETTAISLEESGSTQPVIEYFNSNGSLADEDIEQIVETLGSHNDPLALAAVLRGFPGFQTDRSRLERNSVPCVAIIGENDPNRANLETTAGYMPQLEVVVIDDADHMTTFGDPAFLIAVRAFLARHVVEGRRDS
jgi:pimeloyl-ACP methyl ester carboxylesterase